MGIEFWHTQTHITPKLSHKYLLSLESVGTFKFGWNFHPHQYCQSFISLPLQCPNSCLFNVFHSANLHARLLHCSVTGKRRKHHTHAQNALDSRANWAEALKIADVKRNIFICFIIRVFHTWALSPISAYSGVFIIPKNIFSICFSLSSCVAGLVDIKQRWYEMRLVFAFLLNPTVCVCV